MIRIGEVRVETRRANFAKSHYERQKNDYEVKSKLSRVRARNLLEIEIDSTAL